MLVVRRRVSLARSEIARLAAMLMHAGQYALQLVDKLVDEPGRVSPGPVASTKATVAHAVPFSHKIIAKAEAAVLVRQRRDEWDQDVAFGARPFILCGLPIRSLPSGTNKYTRRNGRFFLEIVGHPDHGVPCGQDRVWRKNWN
jgi:hypothetical protein